jgi:hypothetical protein
MSVHVLPIVSKEYPFMYTSLLFEEGIFHLVLHTIPFQQFLSNIVISEHFPFKYCHHLNTILSNADIFRTVSFPAMSSFEHFPFQQCHLSNTSTLHHCNLSNNFLSNTVIFRTLSFSTLSSFEHFPFQLCHLSNTFLSSTVIFRTIPFQHCNLANTFLSNSVIFSTLSILIMPSF